IIIIVETTYIRPPHSYHSKARCKYLYGNMLNVAMVVGFFILIVPSVVWYLRRDKDAHGIRKEIMITMGVGTPCLVMTIVWQLVFDPPTRKTPSSIRNIYGPMNWLMVVTTTNHIVSIIWPLFKKIPLTTLSTRNTSIMDLLLPRKKTIQRRQQQQQPQQQQNGLLANQQKSKYDPVVELTTESLTQALLNPKMLRVLQTWAVKDFSVENILFYEKYIEFTQKI
ncbi:hypothetical protein BDF20DRAFT_805936, partial [Mycotypha africana]|uniref:uncharacterized protein n=1 Tax=Mycotypha africana TaxID=64632 RepID=UPI0023012700